MHVFVAQNRRYIEFDTIFQIPYILIYIYIFEHELPAHGAHYTVSIEGLMTHGAYLIDSRGNVVLKTHH